MSSAAKIFLAAITSLHYCFLPIQRSFRAAESGE